MTFQSSVILLDFFLFPASIHASLAVTWAHEFRPKRLAAYWTTGHLICSPPSPQHWLGQKVSMDGQVAFPCSRDEISNGKLQSQSCKARDEAINRPRGEHKPKAVSCGNQNQARPRAELHFPHGLVHQRNEVSKSWHLSETYEPHLIYEQFHINLECCSPRPMSWLAGSKCLTILQCGKVLMGWWLAELDLRIRIFLVWYACVESYASFIVIVIYTYMIQYLCIGKLRHFSQFAVCPWASDTGPRYMKKAASSWIRWIMLIRYPWDEVSESCSWIRLQWKPSPPLPPEPSLGWRVVWPKHVLSESLNLRLKCKTQQTSISQSCRRHGTARRRSSEAPSSKSNDRCQARLRGIQLGRLIGHKNHRSEGGDTWIGCSISLCTLLQNASWSLASSIWSDGRTLEKGMTTITHAKSWDKRLALWTSSPYIQSI